VTIHIDDVALSAYQGIIINGRGESVERIELTENTTQIQLVDYVPGIYFLHLMNAEGAYTSKKFSVIH